MHPLRYNALVARLERDAAANPRALRRRVLGLVALGYLYVLTVLAVLAGGLAGIVWLAATSHSGGLAVKLVLIVGALAWMILKSLWVRTIPPEGEPFALERVPLLAARVEEIRHALRAPRADVVLLTHDFNASVVQVPRLGIFGWPRTYLSLGLPLMYAIAPKQFDAVLAHEFAHLSGAHPKRGLWIYRMSRTWHQLEQAMAGQPAGRLIFGSFLGWYAPRLQAYGFVLSRRDEYEADAEAAALCGPSAIAEALVALEVRGRTFTEAAWPRLWRDAAERPTPPDSSWSAVVSQLAHPLPAEVQAQWLGSALRRQALDDDTHPSLADRLRALQVAEPATAAEGDRLLPAVQLSAAGHYLGPVATELLAGLDDRWRTEVEESWRDRHDELQSMRARAAELRARADMAELEGEELFELARAVGALEGDEQAWPLLRRACVALPRDPAPRLLLGRSLLAAGHREGIAPLREAMALDFGLVGLGLELLRQDAASHADRAAVEALAIEQHAYQEQLARLSDERGDVGKRDTLDAATLDDETMAALRAAAAAHPAVTAMWVATKRVQLLPERPMYVIALEIARWRWSSAGKKHQALAQAFVNDIGHLVDGDLLVVVLNSDLKWLHKKFEAIGGALAYSTP